MMYSKAIFIPARLASTRFPNKMLADIKGKPMIQRVYEQCLKTGIKDVFVACCDNEIFELTKSFNGIPVMTSLSNNSGTDRIYEALVKSEKNFDLIVNVQGDIPLIDPKLILKTFEILEKNKDVDISTLCSVITSQEEKENPGIVKPVISFSDEDRTYGNALYFSRSLVPYGEDTVYEHIGIYGYRREALHNFMSFPESRLEKSEKLEQLRALENGMKIGISVVETDCPAVDHEEDLKKVYHLLEKNNLY